jgi:hypothetical protein
VSGARKTKRNHQNFPISLLSILPQEHQNLDEIGLSCSVFLNRQRIKKSATVKAEADLSVCVWGTLLEGPLLEFFLLTRRAHERDKQTNRQADKQTSRQADKQTSIQADKQTSRQADKQTSRQADKQTSRQGGKHAYKQTDG